MLRFDPISNKVNLTLLVGIALCIPIGMYLLFVQVDYPIFGDAAFSVKWEFDFGVVGKSGVGNFDDEVDVLTLRKFVFVEIVAVFQKCNIW